MKPDTNLFELCSKWYENLRSPEEYRFAQLHQIGNVLESDGAYAIWLRLNNEAHPLSLKIGKAQRAGYGLYSRLSEHLNSRQQPSPNILAKHLMHDHELAKRTGLDLTNRNHRKSLLRDKCTFQVWRFESSIEPRALVIFECFLAIKLAPRYIGPCGGYPSLLDSEGEANAGSQCVA